MRRARSTFDEPRLEIMPLVDVVFVLLTFFVFALMLMVRADALHIALPQIGAGDPIEPSELITVAVTEAGDVMVNGEPVAMEDVGQATLQRMEDLRLGGAEARVVIAADERSATRELLQVLDSLTSAGVGNVAIMGRPTGEAAPSIPNQ